VAEPARVTVHASVDIPAPAVAVWELMSDWAGMLRWWLPAGEGGLPGPALISCELIGQPGAVPRTRRMTLSNGTVTDEMIFYQNDQTRRISYLKSDEPSITGYVATTYVADLADSGCTVHLSTMFDVTNPAGRAAAVTRFEAVYAAMFDGYRRYFTQSAR
jgi:Polyketide cyclase / dehydrase and lipid transport